MNSDSIQALAARASITSPASATDKQGWRDNLVPKTVQATPTAGWFITSETANNTISGPSKCT
jgi:hypothetical protein